MSVDSTHWNWKRRAAGLDQKCESSKDATQVGGFPSVVNGLAGSHHIKAMPTKGRISIQVTPRRFGFQSIEALIITIWILLRSVLEKNALYIQKHDFLQTQISTDWMSMVSQIANFKFRPPHELELNWWLVCNLKGYIVLAFVCVPCSADLCLKITFLGPNQWRNAKEYFWKEFYIW